MYAGVDAGKWTYSGTVWNKPSSYTHTNTGCPERERSKMEHPRFNNILPILLAIPFHHWTIIYMYGCVCVWVRVCRNYLRHLDQGVWKMQMIHLNTNDT